MVGYHCTAAFMPFRVVLRTMPEHFQNSVQQKCAMAGTAVPDAIIGSLMAYSTPSQNLQDYQIIIRESPFDVPWDVDGSSMYFAGPLADCGYLWGSTFPDRRDPWWGLQDIAILAQELSSTHYGEVMVRYYFAHWGGGMQTPEIHTSTCFVAQN